MQAAAARGDRGAQAALQAPALPTACAHVWTWFLELNGARGGSGFGIARISYAELAAWAHGTRRAPSRLELEWLKALDELWCEPVKKETPT